VHRPRFMQLVVHHLLQNVVIFFCRFCPDGPVMSRARMDEQVSTLHELIAVPNWCGIASEEPASWNPSESESEAVPMDQQQSHDELLLWPFGDTDSSIHGDHELMMP